MESRKQEFLSPESARKLIDSAPLMKRQERVLEVFNTIDQLKLQELKGVSLVEQARSLPKDSKEREMCESKVSSLPRQYGTSMPSGTGAGLAIGTTLGGLIGLLVARAINDKNYLGWAALGGSLGGAIGGLIGSFWDE